MGSAPSRCSCAGPARAMCWAPMPRISSAPGARPRRWRARPSGLRGILPPEAWTRLSAGDGTKGPRLYDWAYLELADLEAEEYSDQHTGLWTRGLLIWRSITDQDLTFFSTWCPAGTPIDTLVQVEGHRWAIEDAFETSKTELGLTHNETRSWHGWHRHVSLVMLAFAMMAVVRQRANTLTSPQKRNDEARLQRWCACLSRKSAAWPCG